MRVEQQQMARYIVIACVTQSRQCQCHKRHIIEASQTSKCKPCKDLACLGLACSRSRSRPDNLEAKAKARQHRGQGHGFLSSRCPRGRGQSSRTPSLHSKCKKNNQSIKFAICYNIVNRFTLSFTFAFAFVFP